jgi:penicillin-binding protein 1A
LENTAGDKPRSRTRKIVTTTLKVSVAVFLLLLAAGIIYFITLINGTNWKNFDPSKIENQAQTLVFYDKDGKAVGGLFGSQNRVNVQLSDVPDKVQKAFIAIEDVRFYSHPGVDVRRIFGALWADITHGHIVQGGSTITQELVKNTMLTNTQTVTRKLQEARLALQMEQVYSKDQILEMYLNTVYYGNGAYGIEAAAQSYFGKHTSELTVAEGALLAGVLKGPGIYAPNIHLDKSIDRRNLVLDQMFKYKFITQEEMMAAKKDKVNLKLTSPMNTDYGYYLDAAEKEAESLTGIAHDDLVSGGYRIYTTMDSSLQAKCDDIMADKTYFPANAADGTKVQGALVVLDSKSGGVRAVVGGRNYTRQGLNRATSSRRQPGSAIKPVLVYGPAIDRYGYNPASMMLDEPVDFNGYKPDDAGGSYSGWVTLRQAVVRSINIPAVRVLNDIGLESAKDFASKDGITFDPSDNSLAIALGGFTTGVTPLELASAYTSFANSGKYSKASFISKIVDADGNVIFQNNYPSSSVMTDATAFIMTDILHNAAMSGTAKLLNFTAIPLAAKTGTVAWSRGNKDVWIASYNPDYVVVSWMGFDKTDTDHHLSTSVSGGTFPAQVCKEVYTYLYSKTAAPKFQMPDSVTLVALDKQALQNTQQILLASDYTPEDQKLYEYFPKSQAPTQVSQYWQTPLTPTGFSVTLSERGYPHISFQIMQEFVRYDVYRIDGSNNTTKVKEIQGTTGSTASYEDFFVQPGTYSYYISPVHPNLNVTGTPTNSLSITVGNATASPGASPTATGGSIFDIFPFLPGAPTPSPTPTGQVQ